MNSDPKTGVVLVLTAATLWGTTGTAQSLATGALSPLWFGALRLLVAAAFFACCFAAQRGRGLAPATARSVPLPLPALLGAGLSMAAYNLTFFAGVRGAGVAVGTAIALGSGPVWAGVLQSLLARQVPAAGWWLGTALAVGGGVLMTLAGGGTAGGVALGGVVLCLLSGLSYAAYTLLSQRLLRSLAPSAVTLQAFVVAAALAVPAAWWESGALALRWADGLAVLYVGVVTAGIAYLLFSHALRHVSAASAVTLTLGEPVVAFMLAVAVVGERPSAWAFLGLLLVVAGVLAVVRNELAGAAKQGHASGAPADAASSRQLSPSGS
ncbi:DMT family transporter [Azohydromonas caseinilytica]|uniref:EamA family transporter n=1 Tax=Azohydromonas caseinilytica TaxID=2728836 RepID=A0A848FIE4_9BURK|nr:EamA family transporter [Azohydromonas caseinilytica]NML17611.1 EamA family transporter [Azohydromonas caseinilytica]